MLESLHIVNKKEASDFQITYDKIALTKKSNQPDKSGWVPMNYTVASLHHYVHENSLRIFGGMNGGSMRNEYVIDLNDYKYSLIESVLPFNTNMSIGGVVEGSYYYLGGGSSPNSSPTRITYRPVSGAIFTTKTASGNPLVAGVSAVSHADPFTYEGLIYGLSSRYILTYDPLTNIVNGIYASIPNDLYAASNIQLIGDRLYFICYKTAPAPVNRIHYIVSVHAATLTDFQVIEIPPNTLSPTSVKIKARSNYIYVISGEAWNQYTTNNFLERFLRYNIITNKWEVGNKALNIRGAPMFEHGDHTYLMGVDVSSELDAPYVHPSLFKLIFH